MAPSVSINDMKDTTEETHLEYPTGSSVPFPYSTPYPQQTAFMDTLLNCLKQKEDQDDELEKESANTSTGPRKKQRAAVMMLESPTGTG